MIALVIFALVGLIAVYLLAASKNDLADIAEAENPAVYVNRGALMTQAETAAFHALAKALKGKAHVCPKVRAADILAPKPELQPPGRQSALDRISARYVDFAVIDPSGRILFAVMLDDGAHRRRDRRKREAFLDDAFNHAGVALIRVEPGRLNESDRLREAVLAVTGGAEAPLQRPANAA